ncbi:MAG: ribose-phosphate pyrophosphokinase [Pseudomonadota bacterium]
MIDADRLERILTDVARAGRSVSYRELLFLFDRRVGPNNVRALMRVLGEVCRRSEARGEPDLACLVVRESDRLPGEGYFAAEAERGEPLEGSRRARVDRAQATAFAFWRDRPGP